MYIYIHIFDHTQRPCDITALQQSPQTKSNDMFSKKTNDASDMSALNLPTTHVRSFHWGFSKSRQVRHSSMAGSPFRSISNVSSLLRLRARLKNRSNQRRWLNNLSIRVTTICAAVRQVVWKTTKCCLYAINWNEIGWRSRAVSSNKSKRSSSWIMASLVWSPRRRKRVCSASRRWSCWMLYLLAARIIRKENGT